MKIQKKTFSLIAIIVLAAAAAGLFLAGKKLGIFESSGEPSATSTQPEQLKQEDFQPEGMVEGTPDDLIIGETVTVRGTANENGSVTASAIYVGAIQETFSSGFGESPKEDYPTPGESNGEMPERPDFEEMEGFPSDREREFSPESGGFSGQASGQTSFSGEIIAGDETSITVKLAEGGSKLVFYSGSVQVFKEE